jgi:flagellar brake protein
MDNTSSNSPALRTHGGGVTDLEQFLLYGKDEIRQILRAIAEHGELVTLYFGGANDFLLTSVIAVGAESAILDYGSREEVNRRLLNSNRLVFATTRDKIKVQWNSTRIWRVTHDGKPAFSIALPSSLLRLQRREYYRLTAPIAKPLRCQVPAGEPLAKKFEFSVVDLSLGGVALNGPVKEAKFEVGNSYKDCEIHLPETGALVATIVVANLYEVTLRNGNTAIRSGCRFVDLRGKMMMLLQRYINRLERERHERMARLA